MPRDARFLGALVLSALAVGAARAQTRPVPGGAAPAAPVAAEPSSTTASYGDWTLRCANADAPTGPKHNCEAVQILRIQGQQAPFAQVAFGRVDSAVPLRLVVAVPVSVTFPSVVKIGLDDKDPKPLELSWKRCLPGACFADPVASNDLLARRDRAGSPAVHRRIGAGRGRPRVVSRHAAGARCPAEAALISD